MLSAELCIICPLTHVWPWNIMQITLHKRSIFRPELPAVRSFPIYSLVRLRQQNKNSFKLNLYKLLQVLMMRVFYGLLHKVKPFLSLHNSLSSEGFRQSCSLHCFLDSLTLCDENNKFPYTFKIPS